MSDMALLLADVDGTLVTKEKILTERAKTAIAQLKERGIKFAVTSGRPPRGMAMINDALRLETPIAGFNGGVFIRPQDGKVLESHTLARDAVQTALDLIKKHQLVAWLYTADDWYVPDPAGPHVARETWTVKFDAKVAKDFASYLDQAVKIVGVSDDLDVVKACEAACRKELAHHASAARSQPYYLDITHPDANKAAVVDYLAKLYQLDEKKIATIGDMPNDVDMFEKSGLSIAMGQAADDVKAKATKVTASSEDEGFAKAVEDFILSEKPSTP
jgi:Cof subfamily protein (haloacid dehalogenase superfamily)